MDIHRDIVDIHKDIVDIQRDIVENTEIYNSTQGFSGVHRDLVKYTGI